MNEGGAEDYCRALESYLCRKNEGHLIRIVGPAFDQVCGWSARGIPLRLAMSGIDRYFERYYAKGPEKGRCIEFCEADVLDVLTNGSGQSAYRRRVGRMVRVMRRGPFRSTIRSTTHLRRVIARLTTLRAGSDRSLDPVFDDVVRELDAARAKAKSLRGDAREALIDRLRQLDASLIGALRRRCDHSTLERLSAEADEELKPFRARMPAEAYQQSHQACVDRLLRERAGLPTISYE
jgi:hypothetical protein